MSRLSGRLWDYLTGQCCKMISIKDEKEQVLIRETKSTGSYHNDGKFYVAHLCTHENSGAAYLLRPGGSSSTVKEAEDRRVIKNSQLSHWLMI